MAQANLSVVDLFSIGIGPSSSHTVGPMRAAYRFVSELGAVGQLSSTASLSVTLFGSLALTGRGHHTDKAVVLGLSGKRPRSIEACDVPAIVEDVQTNKSLRLGGEKSIAFDMEADIIFLGTEVLQRHTNAMRLEAFDGDGQLLRSGVFYSIGGGFVVEEGDSHTDTYSSADNIRLRYPFSSAAELLELCVEENLSIAEIMLANETAWRDEHETLAFLDQIHTVMDGCIDRGLKAEGRLPGGLDVPRRAKSLFDDLQAKSEGALTDPLTIMDWVNLYALAVNEENASGGQVVTAPTNGAAGIIPAVIRYYERFCPHRAPSPRGGVRDFLLTAAAIGVLYKTRASISGAEVGCQGEVGVACSMAAAGLTAALGGTNEQIENAAEIGMEHNLGLTCDPIGGLVQIPCIERNAMGAIKAINAARLALKGDGSHFVSLDQVIETMRQTGLDMQSKYKETSQGGLAVNVVEC
ncbi:L-serine ammonia-lyase [Magnetovibrio sp. PR-2]|uniref:L-serine ammonia-lyase n=1 Tax=Magnetovibrio sp. PR-2 TaxID=3120356 RepID=UPI002FCE545F